MVKFFRFAIAAAAIAATSPALAGEVIDLGDQVIVKVPFQDLDLAKAAGQTALRQRVDTAARQVCANVTDGETMVDPDFRDCYAQSFGGGWHQAEVKIAAATSDQQVASVGK